MTDRQLRKEMRKMVLPHLAKTDKLVKELFKTHKVDRIPVALVYRVIDEGKVGHVGTPALDKFIDSFNHMMKMVKSLVKECSTTIGDDCVTYQQVHLLLSHTKTSFLETLNKMN